MMADSRIRYCSLILGGAMVASGCSDTVGLEAPPPFTAASVTAGGRSTCALGSDGTAYCWGAGPGGDNDIPKAVNTTVRFQSLEVARAGLGLSACGVATSGYPYCWGEYFGIDVGRPYGTTPTLIEDTIAVSALTNGGRHACALAMDQSALCWGSWISGVRGGGDPAAASGPDPIANLIPNAVAGAIPFAEISAGWHHTCGVATNGQVFCWGYAEYVGDPTATYDTDEGECIFGAPCAWAPIVLSGIPSMTDVVTGSNHTCSLSTGGTIYCWGDNTFGQMGDDGGAPNATPTAITLPVAMQSLAAGNLHTCALDVEGRAYCWGHNSSGQLGRADPSPDPMPVDTDRRFREIAVGGSHTCAIATDDVVYCWGANDGGQLGDGTHISTSAPVAVKPAG